MFTLINALHVMHCRA